MRATPVLVRSEELLEQLHQTVQNADRQLDKLSRGADTFASIAQDVKDFEVGIMNRIRPSVEDVVSLVAGATKGATTFIRTLLSK
jgi:ABC-type transporter Mla subunit MlaD